MRRVCMPLTSSILVGTPDIRAEPSTVEKVRSPSPMVSPRAMSCAGTTIRTVPAKAEPVASSKAGIIAKKPRVTKILRMVLAPQPGRGLQHMIGRRDHLGVHFISALGRDQGGDLVHRIDVGGFQKALLDGAVAGGTGHAGLRAAGAGRLQIEIVADGIEA